MNTSDEMISTAKTEALASHLLDGYLLLREKVALLEPMLFDRDVVDARGKGSASRGFSTLRHTLFLGCVQDIVNLCVDRDTRTPSLFNIDRALKDAAIRKALRERFAIWDSPLVEQETDPLIIEALERIHLREIETRRAQFDQMYQEFVELWAELSASPLSSAFRNIRDKVSAHTEIRKEADRYSPLDIGTLGVKWGDIGATTLKMERLVELCGLLVRNTGFAWDALGVQLKKASDGFWLTGVQTETLSTR